MRKSLPTWILSIWLMLGPLAWCDDLSVSRMPYVGRILFGNGKIYISLDGFAEAMGANLVRTGFGWWVGQGIPDPFPSVPRAQVKIGEQILEMIQAKDTGEYFFPAEEACLALGGTAEWKSPKHLSLIPPVNRFPSKPPELQPGHADPTQTKTPQLTPQPQGKLGPLLSEADIPRYRTWDNPRAFFIPQYRSAQNPDAPASNGNCGPTSLAMVLMAYNRLPPSIPKDHPQRLINWCRAQMTGQPLEQDQGSSLRQMIPVARQQGLKSYIVGDLNALDLELARGHLVIFAGDVRNLGFPVEGPGGHAMVAVSHQGNHYVINDPGGFFRLAGSKLPVENMRKYFLVGLAFEPLSLSWEWHRLPWDRGAAWERLLSRH